MTRTCILPAAVRADLEKVVRTLKEKLKEDFLALALFGSAARGAMQASSDVDILLIAKELPKNRYDRMTWLYSGLPSVDGHRVGLVAYTQQEFLSGFPSFYLDLGVDAEILADTDGFLEKHLERIRKITQEASLARVTRGREMVWIWTKPPWIRNYEITWEGYHEFS